MKSTCGINSSDVEKSNGEALREVVLHGGEGESVVYKFGVYYIRRGDA
jgi:hypothetical protein